MRKVGSRCLFPEVYPSPSLVTWAFKDEVYPRTLAVRQVADAEQVVAAGGSPGNLFRSYYEVCGVGRLVTAWQGTPTTADGHITVQSWLTDAVNDDVVCEVFAGLVGDDAAWQRIYDVASLTQNILRATLFGAVQAWWSGGGGGFSPGSPDPVLRATRHLCGDWHGGLPYTVPRIKGRLDEIDFPF